MFELRPGKSDFADSQSDTRLCSLYNYHADAQNIIEIDSYRIVDVSLRDFPCSICRKQAWCYLKIPFNKSIILITVFYLQHFKLSMTYGYCFQTIQWK